MVAAFRSVPVAATTTSRNEGDDPRNPASWDHSYMMLGVSGGLQDGFPDHTKLDYKIDAETSIPAVFVGKALVRGTKAYLDLMQPGWRQYTDEPGQPLINSNVIVSGCAEHANEYWVYAVDTRQFLAVLNNEPRFLSITPDTALVDLTSTRNDPALVALARHEIARQGMVDTRAVALPIVVVVPYNASKKVIVVTHRVRARKTIVFGYRFLLQK